MKQPKEIFDKKYEFYRNLLSKPAIPLESREMIFNCMEEYADQFRNETKYVYAFRFCENIFDSSFCIISIHKNKRDAYFAMRKYILNYYNNWFDERLLYGKGYRESNPFSYFLYDIKPMNIL